MGRSSSTPEQKLGFEFSHGPVKQRNLHIYSLRKKDVVDEDIKQFVSFIDSTQKKNKEYAAIILNLDQLKLGDQACLIISKIKAQRLEKLNLQLNNIEPIGCYYLSQSTWSNLQELSLRNNYVCDLGCKFIARLDQDMKNLYLTANYIGDEGCRYLSSSKFKMLQKLGLSQNEIGDKGVFNLTKAGWLNLHFLYLTNNKVGEKGVFEFARSAFTKTKIQMSNNKLSKYYQVKKINPNLNIKF